MDLAIVDETLKILHDSGFRLQQRTWRSWGGGEGGGVTTGVRVMDRRPCAPVVSPPHHFLRWVNQRGSIVYVRCQVCHVRRLAIRLGGWSMIAYQTLIDAHFQLSLNMPTAPGD